MTLGERAVDAAERVQHKTHVYVRPWLYPKQAQAIFTPKRVSVIEASTKSGKTVGCIIWLGEQAMRHGKPGREFWWVAPVSAQARIAWRRMRRALSDSMVVRVTESPELLIELDNGAVIRFRSGEIPDNLYGEDVWAVVIDEATRVREESWFAIRSTLTATRGPIRIIGNVKGRKNWAYRMARRAESGEPDMKYSKIIAADAVDAGLITAAEVEAARRDLPKAVFEELYNADPSDDQGNPFEMDEIAVCVADGFGEGPPVAYGVDLAKTLDWTVVIGLNAAGEVCDYARWQKTPWRQTTPRIIDQTLDVETLVDATGVGDPIVEDLQASSDGWSFEGYTFSTPSKQRLMEGLASAIQGRMSWEGHDPVRVRFPDSEYAVIRMELDTFEYQYTRTGVIYTAPEGLHDDAVMALALAVRAWSNRAGDPSVRFI